MKLWFRNKREFLKKLFLPKFCDFPYFMRLTENRLRVKNITFYSKLLCFDEYSFSDHKSNGEADAEWRRYERTGLWKDGDADSSDP